MAIVYRSDKGSALTSDEVDNNFEELEDTFGDYLPLVGGTLSGNTTFSANNTGLVWSTGASTLKEVGGIVTLISAAGFSVDGLIYAFNDLSFQGTTKGIRWVAVGNILESSGDIEFTNSVGDFRFDADLNEFIGLVKLTDLTASTLTYLNASKEIVSLANAGGLLLNNGSGTLSYTTLSGDGTVDSSGVFTAANTVKPNRSFVSGSNATNASTTLADITGLTSPLIANSVYEFEANLTCLTSADTDGTGYAVQFSAAGASVEATFTGSSNGVAGAKTLRISAFNTSTVACMVTSAQSGTAVIKGIVRTGANPGDLTIQHKKFVSGTSTVYIDSFLKVTKI
jgi:hypothetical protein